MSATGKPPRQYPFRGGLITVKEAADHFNVSIKTMYNRLAKCGDNMDAAWSYYENQIRGGKMPMKKAISNEEYNEILQKQKQQRAVDELAAMLCGGADPESDTEPAKVIKVDSETGTMQPLEADVMADICAEEPDTSPDAALAAEADSDTQGEKEQAARRSFAYARVATRQQLKQKTDPERHSLRLHNEAISALDALICDGIDDDTTTEQAESLLDRLRQVRMNAFEYLVPWEQLAGGDGL